LPALSLCAVATLSRHLLQVLLLIIVACGFLAFLKTWSCQMEFSSKPPATALPQQQRVATPSGVAAFSLCSCRNSVQTPSLLIIVACCLTF